MPIPPINPSNDSLNHYQVESGRMERENNEVINEADAWASVVRSLDVVQERTDTVTGDSAVNVHFPVTTAGVEVRVGGSPLAGRHTLVIANDSTTIVSIAEGVNAPFADAVKLFSGQAIQISLDPTIVTTWYLRTEFFSTEVLLIEAKGDTD